MDKPYKRAEAIDFFTEKALSGEIELPMVRKSLQKLGLDDAEIRVVVNQVDKALIKAHAKAADKKIGKNMFYGGIVATAVGLAMTVVTLTGALGSGKVIVIAMGPVVFGLGMVASGWMKMK